MARLNETTCESVPEHEKKTLATIDATKAAGNAAETTAASAATAPAKPDAGPDQLWEDMITNGIEQIQPQFKKSADDWTCIFNPHVPCELDVGLIHTFSMDSAVCHAKFSKDGRRLASACNLKAQVFDVLTGSKMAKLQHPDNSEDKCYVRRVCFSDDGKYLVTGSEDSLVRVRIPIQNHSSYRRGI